MALAHAHSPEAEGDLTPGKSGLSVVQNGAHQAHHRKEGPWHLGLLMWIDCSRTRYGV
jgi:hypothetical protein